MTLFYKYPSLTNHYSIKKSRSLATYLDGDKAHTLFYATEKIDGSNIQLSFDSSTGEYEFYKRSGEFNPDDMPFSEIPNLIDPATIHDMVDKYVELYPEYVDAKVHLYGELFGYGIQKQDTNLAKDKQRGIRFYDMIIEHGNSFLAAGGSELLDIVPEQHQPHLIEKGATKTLSEWLASDPNDESFYGGVNEGYVYKPIFEHTYDPEAGNYVAIKHKTKAYLEVTKAPKPTKTYIMNNPELVMDMTRYVTKQRVYNVISHAEVEVNFKNFGALKKLVNADIIEEYLRDEQPDYTEQEIVTAVNKELNKLITGVVREVIQETMVID